MYIALYREFRPKKFEEVVGQEHVTETLRRQIEKGRVAHAYLLSGGRGSGKTSTAKILARAVNCLHPINGEPCNECEICKAALEGALTDITEIDAASNNGVDNIREIRDEVEFLPTNAKYRVYIIDEVHMLSTGAFNALLKTLEEPPAHVIFILATTEPQKLPVTILSRCQRFDFKKISIANIVQTLQRCANTLDIAIEENALLLIARMADGAMRDAYSILDRCMADGETQITESKVRELVGIPEFEYLAQFVALLVQSKTIELIDLMEKIMAEGKNLEVFLGEVIKFVRDLLILKTSHEMAGFGEKEKEQMQVLANEVTTETLMTMITELAKVQGEMKWSADTEVTFETGILRVALLDKAPVSREEAKPKMVKTEENSTSLKNKVLTKLKENSKMRLCAVLQVAQMEVAEDGMVHIVFESNLEDTSKQYLQQEDTKKALKEAVVEATAQDYKVKYDFQK